MPSTSPLYRLSAQLAAALVPMAGLTNDKVARSHRGRQGALGRLVEWGRRARDPSRPLVWLHAPSVGEGLQAESVLRRLKARHPDWQFAYTWFSPSAETLGRRLPVDVADYLPYDLPAATDALLAALRPDVLAFAKLDLWPELASRAARAGTRVVMVAATVAPGSGRLRWPVRQFLQPGYASLSLAGAISEADAARLERLGVPGGAHPRHRGSSIRQRHGQGGRDSPRRPAAPVRWRGNAWWPARPGRATRLSSSTPSRASTCTARTPD